MPQCAALTQYGKQCSRNARFSSLYCGQHATQAPVSLWPTQSAAPPSELPYLVDAQDEWIEDSNGRQHSYWTWKVPSVTAGGVAVSCLHSTSRDHLDSIRSRLHAEKRMLGWMSFRSITHAFLESERPFRIDQQYRVFALQLACWFAGRSMHVSLSETPVISVLSDPVRSERLQQRLQLVYDRTAFAHRIQQLTEELHVAELVGSPEEQTRLTAALEHVRTMTPPTQLESKRNHEQLSLVPHWIAQGDVWHACHLVEDHSHHLLYHLGPALAGVESHIRDNLMPKLFNTCEFADTPGSDLPDAERTWWHILNMVNATECTPPSTAEVRKWATLVDQAVDWPSVPRGATLLPPPSTTAVGGP